MKLENQVCTIKQGKRLAELGLKTSSIFSWWQFLDESVNEWQDRLQYKNVSIDDEIRFALANSEYPAFTVSELGVMVLPTLDEDEDKVGSALDSIALKYPMSISSLINPNFLADCLIRIIEKNLITAEECNERLQKA